MGNHTYSDSVYKERLTSHASAGTDVFTHSSHIRAGVEKAEVHALLDPRIPNKVGRKVRESCDSDLHPVSLPIGILFDVTGSMAATPRVFVSKLGALMALFTDKKLVEHPHILFGAIGDATCDAVPLQIGQFEAGNAMDEALTKIHLEGGGGGGHCESYELAMYYMARHTEMEALSKRGKKGYLFFMGDELPYAMVKHRQVLKYIGDEIEEDIPVADILAELRKKFEVYWLIPGNTSHCHNPAVTEALQAYFGQNLFRLNEPEQICELIATIVAIGEGHDKDTVAKTLVSHGLVPIKNEEYNF